MIFVELTRLSPSGSVMGPVMVNLARVAVMERAKLQHYEWNQAKGEPFAATILAERVDVDRLAPSNFLVRETPAEILALVPHGQGAGYGA